MQYAWHFYGQSPAGGVDDAFAAARELGARWHVPTVVTEFGECDVWRDAAKYAISHTYWHYSAYCTTGPAFGNRTVPTGTFGACINGWAGANPDKKCRR